MSRIGLVSSHSSPVVGEAQTFQQMHSLKQMLAKIDKTELVTVTAQLWRNHMQCCR